MSVLNRKEAAKDLGIAPPKGKVEKTVKKGQEDKAMVRLIFHGNYAYSDVNNNTLEALKEVLQIKLIERLREEESGVYSPGVRMSYSKYPTGRYTMTVGFGCAPANVEKLINATKDEIAKIAKNGAQMVDLEKFIAEEQRTTEVQLKENPFWSSYLAGQYQNQEDPAKILVYLASLKKITPKTLKKAAKNYLNGKNYIRVVLIPER